MSYKEFIPSCFNQISNWDDELPLFFIGRNFSVPKSATDGKRPVNYRQEKVKTTLVKIRWFALAGTNKAQIYNFKSKMQYNFFKWSIL